MPITAVVAFALLFAEPPATHRPEARPPTPK